MTSRLWTNMQIWKLKRRLEAIDSQEKPQLMLWDVMSYYANVVIFYRELETKITSIRKKKRKWLKMTFRLR